MNNFLKNGNIGIDKSSIRDHIIDFENILLQHPDAIIGDNSLCPLKHSFSDGIYVREIFIPKGMVLAGKIHKHDHPNFLMSGEVDVITENSGIERLKGPCSMISAKGTKRIVHAIEDTVWITVHSNPTNTKDLNKLEEFIISKNYKELDKISLIRKIKNIFINLKLKK